MGTEPWYLRLLGLPRAIAASVGWSLFSWGTGYKGFVCDYATMKPLPCEQWWQEVDSKKGADHA